MAEKKPLDPIQSAPESQTLDNVGLTPQQPPPSNEELTQKPTIQELKDSVAKEVLEPVPMEKFLLDPKSQTRES